MSCHLQFAFVNILLLNLIMCQCGFLKSVVEEFKREFSVTRNIEVLLNSIEFNANTVVYSYPFIDFVNI